MSKHRPPEPHEELPDTRVDRDVAITTAATAASVCFETLAHRGMWHADSKLEERYWLTGGRPISQRALGDLLLALADYVAAEPTAPAEALWRTTAGRVKGLDGEAFAAQPSPTRIAYHIFVMNMQFLLAEAAANARAREARVEPGPPPNRGLFKRIVGPRRRHAKIGRRDGAVATVEAAS